MDRECAGVRYWNFGKLAQERPDGSLANQREFAKLQGGDWLALGIENG